MILQRRPVVPFTCFVLCTFILIAGQAWPPGTPASARPLTTSEQEDLDELRKRKAREKLDKDDWNTIKKTSKDVLFWALDQGIDKVFKPFEVVPTSGTLIGKYFKPTSKGLYRYFVEEPWVNDMYKKYVNTLRTVKTKAFNQRNKTKADLDRINGLLANAPDDESKALLEDEQKRLQQEIDATDQLFDDLDNRIEGAQDAKDAYDKGGALPAGLPKLLKQLNDEVKEMQDRRDRDAAPPVEASKPRCADLTQQQIEIEKKLYAEFLGRRSDPGMVIEAQRAQNEKEKLQAQMADCVK